MSSHPFVSIGLALAALALLPHALARASARAHAPVAVPAPRAVDSLRVNGQARTGGTIIGGLAIGAWEPSGALVAE